MNTIDCLSFWSLERKHLIEKQSCIHYIAHRFHAGEVCRQHVNITACSAACRERSERHVTRDL